MKLFLAALVSLNAFALAEPGKPAAPPEFIVRNVIQGKEHIVLRIQRSTGRTWVLQGPEWGDAGFNAMWMEVETLDVEEVKSTNAKYLAERKNETKPKQRK